MMTIRQYALQKLAEECNEVAQRALKQAQFGDEQKQPGDYPTNAERTRIELLDLHMWESILVGKGSLRAITAFDVLEHTHGEAPFGKRVMVKKMLDLAISLGQVEAP